MALDSWISPLGHAYTHYLRDRPYRGVEKRARAGPFSEWFTPFRSAAVYLFRSYQFLLAAGTLEKSNQRLLNSTEADSVPCRVLKRLTGPSAHTVLFVTYHPQGFISDHVSNYLAHFKRVGCAVVLIKVVDDLDHSLADSCPPEADAALVRLNAGYDFGAWAHGLRAFPEVYQGETLWFANDSVFGPASPVLFDRIVERILQSDADLIGLTEHYECRHHYQSYFFVFRSLPRHVDEIRKYWNEVRNTKAKDDVIYQYELTMKDHFLRRGFKCCALFPTTSVFLNRNPTTFGWENLLNQDFPFLKVSLLRPDQLETDRKKRRESFARLRYDCRLIDQHLEAMLHPEKIAH